MNRITPESAGVSSNALREYIELLEEHNLATHNVLMARGDSIFLENHRAPFNADTNHRMYSVSKSFVALAIGFCLQDGLLQITDRIAKYFPNEVARNPVGAYQKQTIRDMLMMSTEKPDRHWFSGDVKDRLQYYFENDRPEHKTPGALFQYDSSGSFVLGALVENLTGMALDEYLHAKLFDKIGVSKGAHCLKCPGGHAWGDSAFLCTANDLLLIARFVMNGGRWNGEQLLNEDYIKEATSNLIQTEYTGFKTLKSFGYGYFFWRTFDNSYFMNGMGCQLAVCVPDKDMILVYTGDNQNGGNPCKDVIVENFFKMLVRPASDKPLNENASAHESLCAYANGLKLIHAEGDAHSAWQDKVNGVAYAMDKNEMGIKRIMFEFSDDEGVMTYENEQGEKKLAFGLCKNAFGLFPQEGYSKDVGHVKTHGHFYKCAASAAWTEAHKLFFLAQIIDDYLGRLQITASFVENTLSVYMTSVAEDFLLEYKGFAEGTAV